MSSRGSRAKRASHGDIEKASTEEFELLQRGTQNDANRNSQTIDFIKRNFKAKVCDLFTEQRPSRRSGASYRHGSAGSSEDQDPLCQCGFAKSDHATTDLLVADDVHAGADYLMADGVHAATIRSRASVTTKNTSSQRTRLEATPDRPTNAFGSITFHQSRMVFRKAAKYVRLSNESDMNRVVELMTEHWNLVKPEIKPGVILSVVGGGGHFRLSDPHKKTIFDEGLIKVMDMTNGWILSQGMNSGVSKAIGDAVREGQSFQLDPNGEITRAIHCIGIAPWNMIKGREGLIVLDENETTEVKYGVDQVPNLNRLNPDHSHFLFVDDGHTDEMKSILETEKFRAVVEERLRTDYPVVCLLIDGGYKSFLRVVDSLERGTSVLICKGTGRMANILAEAVTFFRTKSDWSDEESFKKSMKSAIESAIKSNLYLKDRAIVESVADDIKNIAIKYQNSLTVFDVDKEALDVTIMGFLDSKSKDVTNRLKLALRCSASASAASKIFVQLTFDDIQAEDRAELFKEALINDQVEFVKLFVDNHALNKDEFLNVEQLRNLYIETLQRQEALYMRLVLKDLKLWVDNGNIRLNHVHRIVKKFTRLYGDLLYFNDKPDNTKDKDKSTNRKLNSQKYFDHPFRELFIWAVLFNRKQLALFFWENCPDPMSDALLGCLLCIGMKRKMQKLCEPFAEEFRLMKRKLQQLVIGIVDQAYNADREKAMLIVQMPIELIGNLNSMDVASIAKARAYFNSTCCEQVISKQWKRGFNANGFYIVLSTWLYPFFSPLIRLDKSQTLLVGPRSDSSNQADNDVTDATTRPIKQVNSSNSSNRIYTTKAANEDPMRIAEDQSCTFKYWKKCYTFYSSPVVKFTVHMTAFLFYMFLYAIVMLFYYPTTDNYWYPGWLESILYFWQITIVCEMFRKIITTPGDCLWRRFQDWWRNGAFGTWNRMDVFSVIISVLAFSLRWCPRSLPFARLLMLIAMLLYFQRVCKMFLVSSYLGPKVIMIKKMAADLSLFLLMFMVFFLSYTISVQSLMHPNRPLYWGIFWDLFQEGIWQTFGELNNASMEGTVDNCNGTMLLFPPEGSWDCFMRVYPIPLFLAVYLFFGSILLINMLIAAFAYIFDNVQAHSKEIWRYQMYFLFSEFEDKPLLPPPFILISHAWLLIKYFYCKSKDYEDIKINGKKVTRSELEFLKIFECVCHYNFINSQRFEEIKKNDYSDESQ